MKKEINKGRRRFLETSGMSAAALSAAAWLGGCSKHEPTVDKKDVYTPSDRLQSFIEISKQPVVDRRQLPDPIIIEHIGVYHNGNHRFVRVTSKDGAVGIAAAHKDRIRDISAIMLNRVIPSLVGEDARDIEYLVDKVYLARSNYKWQGLALWVAMAYVEIAVLDLLGRVSGQSIGDLLGGRIRDKVAIYYASGNRGNSPGEEVEYLQSLVDRSGAKAIKYRLGARMRYTDTSTARDLALIPLARKELGDDVTIYTDANGSYDVDTAIRIGRMLEAHGVAFFEEPCPFDYYEETRAVADALDIPIAGGEEESSMRGMMWLLDHDALQVIQPDLLYFGGLTRSVKVARMAASIGIDCTAHISGSALGFLYMMQFASCVPNIGPYQEFKGNTDRVPVHSDSSSLQSVDGLIDIPTEPGLGVEFDPDFISQATEIETT
ncbi:MAG: mandelate racemase/muconate lactonizing enzyme family protein [Gammaproteobacteria bacterium]|nr:MAG: mandelate racemase/muconate lactonizing enzyme family protein [Gammaproteobacteria bacterium]